MSLSSRLEKRPQDGEVGVAMCRIEIFSLLESDELSLPLLQTLAHAFTHRDNVNAGDIHGVVNLQGTINERVVNVVRSVGS